MNADANDNDNPTFPPIQLLIPICATVDDGGMRLAWLHGYSLVTFWPGGAGMQLAGQVRIAERYGENLGLIRDLADALDPDAVLAGYDLTDVIGKLGRLPIEANEPQPALDLLAKLKSMLEFHDPIDLAIDDNSQTEVTLQLLRHEFGNDDELYTAADDDLFEFGLIADQDSTNPHRLAVDLVETAGAYLLAIGELYLSEEFRPALLEAVANWQSNVQPQLPLLVVIDENGGEPIVTD